MFRFSCRLMLFGFVTASLLSTQPAGAQTALVCSGATAEQTVQAAIILECLRSDTPVTFDRIVVDGDLDLTPLSLADAIPALTLTNSRFTGALIAYDSDDNLGLEFQNPVDLRGSRFNAPVDFTGTVFTQYAHFENTRFDAEANFTQANFQQAASFHSASFAQPASFMLATLPGGTDFTQAKFESSANFALAQSPRDPNPLLTADVSFTGARFTGNVYFMNTFFENDLLLQGAVFRRQQAEDTVQFTGATFQYLNMTDAQFEEGQLNLNGITYQKIFMANFQPAILYTPTAEDEFAAFMAGIPALKENFRPENPAIANEIAYWQYPLLRAKKPPLARTLETITLDWVFGYGLKPLRAVNTAILLILFFAIFYYPAGILQPAEFVPAKPRERRFTIRLTEIPIAHQAASDPQTSQPNRLPLPPQVAQAWQAVVFSFSVFTKLSSGTHIAVRRGTLVIIEWIIGLMVIAGLLFSIANTNPLLRSILNLL